MYLFFSQDTYPKMKLTQPMFSQKRNGIEFQRCCVDINEYIRVLLVVRLQTIIAKNVTFEMSYSI